MTDPKLEQEARELLAAEYADAPAPNRRSEMDELIQRLEWLAGHAKANKDGKALTPETTLREAAAALAACQSHTAPLTREQEAEEVHKR